MRIPDPGSRMENIPDPQHCLLPKYLYTVYTYTYRTRCAKYIYIYSLPTYYPVIRAK
jgi:hypothetical protein